MTFRNVELRQILTALVPVTESPNGGKILSPGARHNIGLPQQRRGFNARNLDPATGAQLRYRNTRPTPGAADAAFFAIIQTATPAISGGGKQGPAVQPPTGGGGVVGVGQRYG